MTNYTYPFPAGQDVRDVKRTIQSFKTPTVAPVSLGSDDFIRVGYTPDLTPAEQAALGVIIAATTADPAAPWRVQDNRTEQLRQAVLTLRQWATDAQGTTVTSGNAVATLQVIVNRFGIMSSRLADLVQNIYQE